jgi:hypothetical protein
VNDIRISSVIDARRYREELAERVPEEDPLVTRLRLCERCVLLIVLAVAFLMYYLISINVQILSLPELNISVPMKVVKSGSAGRGSARFD